MTTRTYFSPDDWGPEFPLSGSRYSIPMPTLYSTEGYKFKKPSIIELVLYNMAALLGGVAAGYDVRMSNVSPLHPTLQPHSSREVEPEPLSTTIYEGYGYAHNTYHGPTRHLRAPLNSITGSPISSVQVEDARPLRFTDSPLGPSSSSGYGHSAPPLSSPSLADLYHNYRDHFPSSTYSRYDDERRQDYASPTYSRYDEDYRHDERRDERRREEYRTPLTEYRTPDYSLPRDFYREEPERPANLELAPTRLRSSLKKNKKSSGSSVGSGAGTPPDSLPSESDSSYASARDSAHSRVRFSPGAPPRRS